MKRGFGVIRALNRSGKKSLGPRLPVDRAGRPEETETKSLSVGRPPGRPDTGKKIFISG